MLIILQILILKLINVDFCCCLVPPTSLALYLHEEQRSITEYTVLQPVKENTPYSASCTASTGTTKGQSRVQSLL